MAQLISSKSVTFKLFLPIYGGEKKKDPMNSISEASLNQ
tara:strand:- start:441 stop:557 length:117 start_codon:yes stop_codon:yes gene_type:complete